MKGIHIQFESIVRFLEGAMDNQIVNQTEECFLLNAEKMTFETFKLVDIIFNDLESNIPKNIHIDFNKTVGKLKEYFKMKPKTRTQEDYYYKEQYDQVSRYLDNRPQMTTSNDQARGQLFKFLSLAQQKESNTKTLLSAIPRYSNTNLQQQLTKFNSPHVQSGFGTINICNDPISDKVINNIVQDVNGLNEYTSNKVVKSKKKQICKVVSQQTQTEYNAEMLKQIISDFTKNSLKTEEYTCDFASKISDFLNNISEQMNNTIQIEEQIDIGELQKEETMEAKKQKKQTSLVKDKTNEKTISKPKKNKKDNKKLSKDLKSIVDIKQQNSHKNNQNRNKENQSQQFMEKQDKSNSNGRVSIQSETKLKNNERGLKSHSQFKKEKLKNQKNHQIEKLENQNPPENDDSQFLNIDQYKYGQKTELCKKNISVKNSNENKQNYDFQEQIYSQLLKQNEDGEELDKYQCLQNIGQSVEGKMKSCFVSNSRQKIVSNKDQTQAEVNKTFEQAYSTYNQSKFRNTDSKEDEGKNLLPKIQQKIVKINKSEKSQKLKQKLQHSPYSKQLLKNQDQNLSRSSLANQFNNRSLHMNPSQSLFLPKDLNRTLYRDSIKPYYASGERQKNCLPNIEAERLQQEQNKVTMTEEQRQAWLKEQQDRLMNQIEQNIGTRKNKDTQFLKAIKNIREYEVLHLRLCGQNCIHLQKFNQFLKRKNISMYSNRKQLYLHKRNIEINFRNK